MKLRLRELRKDKKLSQSDVAEMVGVTVRVVGGWERQDTQITLEDAVAVSKALGCTPNDLCGWYDEHPEDCPSASVTRDESTLLSNYRASPPEGREFVARAAMMACGQGQEGQGASSEAEAV